MELEVKALAPGAVDWSVEQEGEFVARFSTFGAIDAYGDITTPETFDDGQAVIVGAWGHDRTRLPVGRGVVRVRDDGAYIEGRFFTETQTGADTWQTVRALGELQQWSYLFIPTSVDWAEVDGQRVRVLRRVHLISVDPVDLGAGVGTATVAIKGLPLAADVRGVADEARRVAQRLAERAAVRGADGRGLGSAAEAAMQALADLRAAADTIEAALGGSGQLGAIFAPADTSVDQLAAYAAARASIARAIATT